MKKKKMLHEGLGTEVATKMIFLGRDWCSVVAWAGRAGSRLLGRRTSRDLLESVATG